MKLSDFAKISSTHDSHILLSLRKITQLCRSMTHDAFDLLWCDGPIVLASLIRCHHEPLYWRSKRLHDQSPNVELPLQNTPKVSVIADVSLTIHYTNTMFSPQKSFRSTVTMPFHRRQTAW